MRLFSFAFIWLFWTGTLGGDPGFVTLFDGKSLAGWTLRGGHGQTYAIENGTLICPANADPTLFTDKEYADFVLRFEFKVAPAANSGIAIRAPLDGRASQEGIEIQILDDRHPDYKGTLKPEHYHGSIYDVLPARTGFQKPVGEWNEEEITAQGRRIRVKLNGVLILDVDLDMIQEPQVLKRHPGLQRTSGHIGLMGHWSRVEFRNLRIKPL